MSVDVDDRGLARVEAEATPPAGVTGGGSGRGGRRPAQQAARHRLLRWLREGRLARGTAAMWMVGLVVAPMIVVVFTVWGGIRRPTQPEDVSVAALKITLVGCLSFLPGWLYVRFLGQRAGALWNEYVLHLHRLGWDRPQFLPEPPQASQFYAEWRNGGGAEISSERNVYRQKFNAYFGRAVSDTAGREDFVVRTDTMFPVFLATAVMSTGWTAVLWDVSFITDPSTVWDVLKFAFVGAYVFSMQSLVRRFFQSDLRPSAYASALLRFVVVLAVMVALHQLIDEPTDTEAALAFVVGIFPVIALQALQRAAAAVLGLAVPQASPDYPLNQIDGLDLWYEARLLEEGIEDMQNLATANLVDVILHTRVPVTRLVDWVDQAHLYLHLDRAERGIRERRRAERSLGRGGEEMAPGLDTVAPDGAPAQLVAHAAVPRRVQGSVSLNSRAGTRTRLALRQLGIRTATDLLKAFPADALTADCDACGAGPEGQQCLLSQSGLDVFQLRTLVRVLSEEPGLTAVWNWQKRGVPGGRS